MADRPLFNVETFHEEVANTLAQFQAIAERGTFEDMTSSDLAVVARAAHLALVAAAATIGECRDDTPYAGMYPVMENGQFMWCCTHKPRHCHP